MRPAAKRHVPGDGGRLFSARLQRATAREIDEEVKRLLSEAYDNAKTILNSHHDKLDQVTIELLKSESLDAPTFYSMLGLPVPKGSVSDVAPIPPVIGG